MIIENHFQHPRELACNVQSCVRNNIKDGKYHTSQISKSNLLFHGFKKIVNRPNIIPTIPTWYSDAHIASAYTKNRSENCWAYELIRDVKLIDLTNIENIKLIYNLQNITPEQKKIISISTGYMLTHIPKNILTPCKYQDTIKNPEDLYFCAVGFINHVDQSTQKYINSRLAEIICTLGFDGWIITPNSKIQDAFDTTSNIVYEVLLCKPNKTLKPTQTQCLEYF